MRKSYFALFTCCVTRAVHLELVEDLSVETFKRCLRRFIARRGIPALIVSDNAKTFKGTEKQLRTLFRHPQVREEMQNHRIERRFNLERTPWWGGFFERMVGCVKRCLKNVLGNARLTYDELLTVLTEVEATLNSRPLTYDYDKHLYSTGEDCYPCQRNPEKKMMKPKLATEGGIKILMKLYSIFGKGGKENT